MPAHPRQHHAHAGGVKTGSQALGDLLGQPLLDRGLAAKMLNQPGQLGQQDDALAGQVADVREAGELQQMMLADGGCSPARRIHVDRAAVSRKVQ